jgi:hypothetical protein
MDCRWRIVKDGRQGVLQGFATIMALPVSA